MDHIKNFFLVIGIIFITLFTIVSVAAGDVDLTFDASTTRTPGSSVQFGISIQTATTQPDGKILIGGGFEVVNGQTRSKIARLNQDGSLDLTFFPADLRRIFNPDYNVEIIETRINSIGLQSDGKIIIGGSFSYHNGVPRAGVARLNPNGTLDTTFNPPSFSGSILDIKVQPDDKIIVGTESDFGFKRLNSNGTIDSSFELPAGIPRVTNYIALQTDGKILVSGYDSSNQLNSKLVRLNSNGSTDNTFSIGPINNGYIETVAVQADGKILIGGTFSGINGFASNKMARLETDGSLDVGFATISAGANGNVFEIQIGAGGKIFVGGSFSTFNGAIRERIVKLNTDGTVDPFFNINTTSINGSVLEILEMSSGNLLVGGNFTTSFLSPQSPSQPLILTSNGTIDNSVFNYLGNPGAVTDIAVQADGKVLAGGIFTVAGGAVRNNLARFNADGTLDTSFVPFPTLNTTAFRIYSIKPLSDGKILVGYQSTGSLIRLNSDGSNDSTFNAGLLSFGLISDLAVLPDGKIIAVGQFRRTTESNDRFIARFNADGSFDSTFNAAAPNAVVYKLAVQPDGKILIGGGFTTVGGIGRGRIARLEANGALDTTFNTLSGANGTVYNLALQSDGKVVLVGAFTALNGSNFRQYVGRLNADGTLDTSFSQTASRDLYTVKVDNNGKILIGGTMGTVGGVSRYGLARLNSNGSVDNSFNVGTGANYPVHTIELQTDGKILIGGEFSRYKDISKPGIARLLTASTPLKTLFDFDGDRRADVSVFRSSENRWYIFRSSDGQITQQSFAITGDKPVPADFDGDGKTDIAIFRPANGDWWSLSSSNNAQITANLGNADDIKLPSDFDGDGRADYVIYRPSNNFWYRLGSTGLVFNVGFGLSGDKPVSGDFDGDGKSDVAIFRPSTGEWWWQSMVDNIQRATRWGISTDIPVPADYDGDGKTDFAVYRPSTGVWYIYNSSTGNATIMAFGLAEDKPIAADYDGDGKADIAVFRPSTGVWYQMRSTAGFSALQFGISTDIPTPNAFVP